MEQDIIIFMMIGMAQFGALVKFWPYNLTLTLKHYNFEVAGLGWDSFYNSVRLAFFAAVFGTIIIFIGSYFLFTSFVSTLHPIICSLLIIIILI